MVFEIAFDDKAEKKIQNAKKNIYVLDVCILV